MSIMNLVKKLSLPHIMKVKMLNEFNKMDRDLLGERLRHLVHSLDLITKSGWTKDKEGKGRRYASDIRKIVEIWQKRGYEDNGILNWTKAILEKFERWDIERDLQIKICKSFAAEENFWNIIQNRRSIRKWEERVVPKDIIEKVIDAARWAPSSCNRQSWKFTVVTGDKKKLLKHSLLEDAPVVILISIDERPYFFHERYAPALDVGFAAENILLSAHVLKLGACPVYYAHSHAQSIKKQLRIEPYRKVYLAIALGYPLEHPDIPVRSEVRYTLEEA